MFGSKGVNRKMSREILTKYRTKVIEDFIKIEGYINTIICMHYLGCLSVKFFWQVLQDELFNFGLRVNILEKIFKDVLPSKELNRLIDDLRRLSKIRNYFAHCNTSFFEPPEGMEIEESPHSEEATAQVDIEARLKEFEEFEEKIMKSAKGGVPHPKKMNEYLDFNVLYKEFEEKYKTIEERLVQVMDKMGIWFKIDDNGNMTIYGLKK